MVTYDAWPAHNHGPSEGRGMDCGEKPIGWCIRLAKDAELAELRADVERLRQSGVDWMGRYDQLTEFARGAEVRAESAEATVARVETVADEWEGLAGYLRTHHADNPAIMREAYGHAIAAEKVRAALDGAE